MFKPILPGMRCRVVDSSKGIQGTSVGRIVRVEQYADPVRHFWWGVMVDCSPDDGKGDFEAMINSPCSTKTDIKKMSNATFATVWLEPIEEDPLPPKEETRLKEIHE